MNPCIKTGATVYASGQWWHGDLFNFGEYSVLNCNAGPQYSKPDFVHAEYTTWYTTFQNEQVVVLKNTDCVWFNYEGKYL